MSATDNSAAETEEIPKKKGMLGPILVGLVLAGITGGGGFFAVSAGLIGGSGDKDVAEKKAELPEELAKVAFVPLDPVLVDVNGVAGRKMLRFRAEVEVNAPYQADVAEIKPRIMDVINGYLRAVDPEEFEQPSALLRLRAQLLRRVQMVAGEGRVRDLLVMEFVLN